MTVRDRWFFLSRHFSGQKSVAPRALVFDFMIELKENPLALARGVEQTGVEKGRIPTKGVQTDPDRVLTSLLNKVNELWSSPLDLLSCSKGNFDHIWNVTIPNRPDKPQPSSTEALPS